MKNVWSFMRTCLMNCRINRRLYIQDDEGTSLFSIHIHNYPALHLYVYIGSALSFVSS
jgi:hypothetical protein